MGGGSSMPSTPVHRAKVDPFQALFLSQSIFQVESELTNNSSFRHCFIEFIKNGRWVDKLSAYEDLRNETGSQSLWDRFGYPCPDRRRDEASTKSSLKSAGSFQTLNTLISDASSRHSSVKDSTKQCSPDVDIIENWSLCSSREDVRAIMLILLCPLFFASREYKQWSQPTVIVRYSSSSDSERYEHHDPFQPVNTRLRDMMLSAAAAFDSADLEAYLSKPSPSFTADFKSALNNLPLRFNILDVDFSNTCAADLYESSGKLLSSPSSRSMRSVRELAISEPIESSLPTSASPLPSPMSRSIPSEGAAPASTTMTLLSLKKPAPLSLSCFSSSPLPSPTRRDRSYVVSGSGAGMLSIFPSKLCSAYYTAEQRQLVETALAEQARLKLAVTTSYDRCLLRALKPVYGASGAVRCMLSVESLARVPVSKAEDLNVSARTFQQVDDLLLLLPALIKLD